MRKITLYYRIKNNPDAEVKSMLYSFGNYAEVPQKLNLWNSEHYNEWLYWLSSVELPLPEKAKTATDNQLGIKPSNFGICNCTCAECKKGPHTPKAGCKEDYEWKPVYNPSYDQMQKLDYKMLCLNCKKDFGHHSDVACWDGVKKLGGVYTVKQLTSKLPKLPKLDKAYVDWLPRIKMEDILKPSVSLFNGASASNAKVTAPVSTELGFCKGLFCNHEKKAHVRNDMSFSCIRTWKSITDITANYFENYSDWSNIKCVDCGKNYSKHYGDGYCYLPRMLGYRPDAIFNPVLKGICSGALCGSKPHTKTSSCQDWMEKK